MDIRGDRECTACGTRWSYFETGSVGCPACGSLRSVATGERSRHTDTPVEFDLTAVRAAVDDVPTGELAERAKSACREYVRNRGFVRGGDLRELDETYVAATELSHAADLVGRATRPTEDEELYFLALLRDADAGIRPDTEDVPPSFREARGLAVADAVGAYRRDVRQWVDARETALEPAARSLLETLTDYETRLDMLEGDVDPEIAEDLLAATRHLGYGVQGDAAELERARERLADVFGTESG